MTAGRVAALRELFPEAFTENRFDPSKIEPHLSVSADDSPPAERYGLSWAGKADAMRAVQVLSTGTLHPDRNESVDFDSTSNLMVEGDNLEVLKLPPSFVVDTPIGGYNPDWALVKEDADGVPLLLVR